MAEMALKTAHGFSLASLFNQRHRRVIFLIIMQLFLIVNKWILDKHIIYACKKSMLKYYRF